MSRVRQVLSNIGAAYLTFAIASVCYLIGVPIYLRFLGREQFGLWLTIQSVLIPLTLTSMGFPTVGQNMLAEARATRSWERANRVISTTFMFLIFAALVTSVLVLVALRLDLITRLLKTSPGLRGVLEPTVLLALAGFVFMVLSQVLRSAIRAFERVDLEQHCAAALAAANLGLGVAMLYAGRGIVGVAAAFAFVQFAGGVLFFIILVRRLPQLHLSARFFSWILLREMLAPGFYFFVLSLSGTLIWGVDNLVISSIMGLAFVAPFAIAARLTTLFRGVASTPFTTSNPTITALSAECREGPLRHLFSLSTKLALSLAMLFALELLLFGRSFIALWAGSAVVIDRATFAVLVATLAVYVLQQPAFAFLTATSRHKLYARLCLLEGLANLWLSWWWAHRWGVFGVALGTLVPEVVLSGCYMFVASMRMSRLGVSELWARHAFALVPPVLVGLAAGMILRTLAGTWRGWVPSAALTAVAFLAMTWVTSTTAEERNILVVALGLG